LIISGIYQIECLKNNKKYIGSAINLSKRRDKHFSDLRNCKHENNYLQKAWNKYGEDNFEFSILESQIICEDLLSWEQAFLDYYQSYKRDKGYNIRQFADSNLGIKFGPRSEEVKQKMRDNHGGSMIGKHHTEEAKKAISDKNKGKNGWNYGKPKSLETRQRISDAKTQIYCKQNHELNTENTYVWFNVKKNKTMRCCNLCKKARQYKYDAVKNRKQNV
jgi:group I intron endonuclease